jgi:hypothetical protein
MDVTLVTSGAFGNNSGNRREPWAAVRISNAGSFSFCSSLLFPFVMGRIWHRSYNFGGCQRFTEPALSPLLNKLAFVAVA